VEYQLWSFSPWLASILLDVAVGGDVKAGGGASDPPNIAIVAVAIKSADVKPVDDPREAGALAECAVKAAWVARAGWGVEGDGL